MTGSLTNRSTVGGLLLAVLTLSLLLPAGSLAVDESVEREEVSPPNMVGGSGLRAVRYEEDKAQWPGRREGGQPADVMMTTSPPGTRMVAGATEDQSCDAQCQEDLKKARDATERFWLVDEARAGGFAEVSGCQSSPEGAVGIHYTHLGRSLDHTVDVEQPESLLYMPEGLGSYGRVGAGRRLVGVEYSVPVLGDGREPPVLFGQRFQGPAPSPVTGLPQYRLRVWLFSANPNGMFAEAHPAEACDGRGLLAPHAYHKGLHEVFGRFSVPAECVRAVLKIPDELRLRGAGEDESGNAEVWVSTGTRRWSDELNAIPSLTKTALPFVALEAPDWSGDFGTTSLYPFSWVTDNQPLVDWMRQGMGVGSDVIRHSPDLELSFYPIVGKTGPGYQFRSPDFVLDATLIDPTIDAYATSIRIWHESEHPERMGLLRLWFDSVRLSFLTDVQVTPTPGTALGELLGDCDPGSTPGSRTADFGLVVTTKARSPLTASTVREWWNPRHDLSDDNGQEAR